MAADGFIPLGKLRALKVNRILKFYNITHGIELYDKEPLE